MLEAQQAAARELCPGNTFESPDKAARQVLEKAGLAQYFVHITGHGVGLRYHEFIPFLAPGVSGTLEEGMVSSVEPGVYIPDFGGMRIEDNVAVGPNGAVAWSAGKTAHVVTDKGERRAFDAPSTVAGLAFAPKGFRLAIAHYNGATLWFPNAPGAKPETLTWKGSHLSAAFSPDGRFVVTSMQEPTLHGWRLADGHHMRMSGYSARVRSLGWTAGGDFLATSGSEQLILWPFDGKDGPMGRQPKIYARSEARVSVVACHPRQPVVAAGFADGSLVLVRTGDGALIAVRDKGGAPVSAWLISRRVPS